MAYTDTHGTPVDIRREWFFDCAALKVSLFNSLIDYYLQNLPADVPVVLLAEAA